MFSLIYKMRLSLLSWFPFCQTNGTPTALILCSAPRQANTLQGHVDTPGADMSVETRDAFGPLLRGVEWGGCLTYFDGEWRAPRKCSSGAQSKQKQASSESGFKTGKTWRPAELSVTVETSAPHQSVKFVNLPSQVPPCLSRYHLGPLGSMAHAKSQSVFRRQWTRCPHTLHYWSKVIISYIFYFE